MSSRDHTPHTFATPVHAHGAVAVWWRVWYRLLRVAGRPLVWLTLRHGFGNLVVLHVAGRRTGGDRSLPLGLLTVGDQRYVGHPSGDTGWTLNLRAADTAAIERASIAVTRVRGVILEHGPERDSVVRATFDQHPFPGQVFYRLAGRHVAATGVFFRLEDTGGASPPA